MSTIEALFQKGKQNLADQITQVYKAATGQGAMDMTALVPPNLQNEITNMVQYMNPLNALMTPVAWKDPKGYAGVTAQFPRLTQYRTPGNYGGEKSDGLYSNTTFDRPSVNLKAKKSRFKVWNLGKRASEGYIDMVAATLAGEAQAFGLDFALGVLFDNYQTLKSASDTAFGAWEKSFWTQVQANRYDKASSTDGTPTLPTDLTFFQQAYVDTLRNGGEGHRKAWIMSPEMAALIVGKDQGGTNNFRLNQDVTQNPGGVGDGTGAPFEVHLGRWPKTLFNIPVYTTTLCGGGLNQGTTVDTMGSITLVSQATGGSMSNTVTALPLNFKVAKVIRKFRTTGPSYIGLSQASAATAVVLANSTATQSVKISFSADTEAIWYAVYSSGTSTNPKDYVLVGFFPARTYDADGNIEVSVSSGTVQSNSTGFATALVIGTITPVTDSTSASYGIPAQGVIGKMYLDHAPISTGGVNSEFALLIDREEIQGAGEYRYLDESADEQYGFATMKDVSQSTRTDSLEYMLYSYGTPMMRYPRTCALINNIRAQ